MKKFDGTFQYKEKTYGLVFNLNVMETIQEKYGTIEKWGELSDGTEGEPDAKAIKFAFREMLNEWIDINNEEKGIDDPELTLRQVGRIISELGIEMATSKLNQTVVDSTQSAEKNA